MAVTIKEFRLNALVDSVDKEKEGAKYEVRFNRTGFSCSCPDFKYRERLCKHCISVMLTICERAGMVIARKGE